MDHLYKDCSIRRLATLAGDPKTSSINLLGIERGKITHIPLDALTQLQARAMRQELKNMKKKSKNKLAQPRINHPSQKHHENTQSRLARGKIK